MDIECTCNGEAHDECRPCVNCGETPALDDYTEEDGSVTYLCTECYEERVELDLTETYLRNE